MISCYQCTCICIYLVFQKDNEFMKPHCPVCLEKSEDHKLIFKIKQCPIEVFKGIIENIIKKGLNNGNMVQ